MNLVKKIIFYLLFVAVFYGTFTYTQWFFRQMQLEAVTNWQLLVPYLKATLINIVPGILLGLEQLLTVIHRKGCWRLDWVRLIFLGIPALYLNFVIVIGTFTNGLFIPQILYLMGSDTLVFGGTILGYVVVTSFKKEPQVLEDNVQA